MLPRELHHHPKVSLSRIYVVSPPPKPSRNLRCEDSSSLRTHTSRHKSLSIHFPPIDSSTTLLSTSLPRRMLSNSFSAARTAVRDLFRSTDGRRNRDYCWTEPPDEWGVSTAAVASSMGDYSKKWAAKDGVFCYDFANKETELLSGNLLGNFLTS